MKNNVVLRNKYCLCLSGGKDSLYMLMLVLSNLNKYPLDYVIHYELEIDFPFIRNVIDYCEEKLKEFNIPLIRIKPRQSWLELYEKYSYPSFYMRWCNSKYKMDCVKQFKQYLFSYGCKPCFYIGFCSDEEERFKYEIGNFDILNADFVYPLAEEGIEESIVLDWARYEPLFNDYYKYNDRCGCMGCPLSSYKNWSYLYKFYPGHYNFFMSRWLSSPYDKIKNKALNVDKKVKSKYIHKVFYQTSIFDFLNEN